jgi:hypothetical protein
MGCVKIVFAYLRLLGCQDGASYRLFDKLTTEQIIFKAKESRLVQASVPSTGSPAAIAPVIAAAPIKTK